MQLCKTSHTKIIILKILFILISSNVYAKNFEKSQTEIIFETNTLKNLELQVKFNKGVLELKKNNFNDSIQIFKETSILFPVPSNLNIGIAYYKLNDKKNAIAYFKKIYDDKMNIVKQTYSFIISCYYLYEITKNKEYIVDLAKIFKNSHKLDHESDIIVKIKDIVLKELSNKYLEVNDYVNSLEALNAMSYSLDLKKAMLYIKLKQYKQASDILKNLKNTSKESNDYNKILWISTFVELKLNNFSNVKSNLDEIEKETKEFKENIELPIQILFNKNPYDAEYYFNSIIKFDHKRQLSFLYYFAPFIFSDTEEIMYDLIRGFVYTNSISINSLTSMLDYNSEFLDIIKKDPIKRVQDLKNNLNKQNNPKSYMLYNLGLAYAQVNDIDKAIEYFKKAHILSPGNCLYAAMYLLSTYEKQNNLTDLEKFFLLKTIQSKNGLYGNYAKEIYNLFAKEKIKINSQASLKHKDTIFYKAIDFLKKMNKNESLINHPLLEEYKKDPLIYLIKLVQIRPRENNFKYFSRIQHEIPLVYNNNFLEGPLIINEYYIAILKSLGIFEKADFNMYGNENPTYIVSKVMKNLYENQPHEAINNLNLLKEKYNYENRFSMYLNISAYLEAKRYYDSSIQISLIKTLYNDPQTNILIAIQLIQALEFNSAKQFLLNKYDNHYIDFELIGFDEFLLSL